VAFLTRSATFHPQPTTSRTTQGGAAAMAHRRHGLYVEDEGLLKNIVVIFIFLEVLYTVGCFF
jgi:hypothetical protein